MTAKNNRILNKISKPSDIHTLSDSELEELAKEIRAEIIEVTSNNGGHIAASLGAVDLIVAVHSLFNVPQDKLIFDVGHQSYAHILLSERIDNFKTLREYGGIPGFPRPSTNEFYSNVAGHASDSLSIAAGYAISNNLENSSSNVITIIGDASIEGGMALEALNYIGSNQLKMIIILNDNAMGISPTVGAITRHLGNVRASTQYRDVRKAMKKQLEKKGQIGKKAASWVSRTKASFKSYLLPHATLFEKMGIMCTPPIDGNNIREVKDMLKIVKDVDGPVIVHAITKKGKGYEPAENNPEKFHGVGKFDIVSGQTSHLTKTTWTEVFSSELVKCAQSNEKIIALTAAMEGGCGLKEFHKKFPDRFIDVGIAEENAVGIASGLAYSNKIPVVCIYSTFLQRAIDQMMIDVCLENKHVVFAIDRAGIVGKDGPTHHGIFDIAYLRMMPNMTILTPSDAEELRQSIKFALNHSGPVAIRYPKGEVPCESSPHPEFRMGKSRILKNGDDVSLLSFGKMTQTALKASILLEKKGLSCSVIDMRFAKPLDSLAIQTAKNSKVIATLEDGILQGGASEAIRSQINEKTNFSGKLLTFAIDNKFVQHGNCTDLFTSLGLDSEHIANEVLNCL